MMLNSRLNSLRLRLLVSTALLVAVVMPATALLLTSYYRHAIERAFDARLNVHLGNLIAVSLQYGAQDAGEGGSAALSGPASRPAASSASGAVASSGKARTDDQGEQQPIDLGEPLFQRPFSGWYWQIRPLGQPEDKIIISDSLLDYRLAPLSASGEGDGAGDGLRRGYLPGPDDARLRVLERKVIFGEDDKGVGGELFLYTLAVDAGEIELQVAGFRNMLLLALGLLSLGLIMVGFWQVRFGLKPLDDIRRRLNDIRAGEADYLTGQYPREIEPLQKELNALLRSNRDIVERARTHVGNLAHALKTPISVIANETDRAHEAGGEVAVYARKVEKQTGLMRDQVRHHLDRARMAAQMGVIGSATSVLPVVEALARTLQKIHRQRHVDLELDCPAALTFGGERQDLEEMLGNLLDNAFKWAEAEVRLKVAKSPAKSGYLCIEVDDDGPGLSADKREQAVRRGQRLDENLPGSGLGLSIVADLSHLYNGSFELGRSPSGGLRAILLLPIETGPLL